MTFVRAFFLGVLFWCLPLQTFAAVQNCTFAWNARTDADLAGYRVLWGTTSGVYPNTVVLGTVTTVTCSSLGITSAGTYYAVVRYYDTSGNISANSPQVSFTLATVTPPSTAPTITSFTPSSGSVGDSVTIIGTNFSSTLSNNTVKFNGATASLSSGTTTQLIALVPSGATTGKISVATAAGTATSSGDFTVSTAPPGTVYDSTADFSGVQGPVWYYLNEDYSQMTFSGGLWNGAELYQGWWDTGGHPGYYGSNSILRWVCPTTATWNVSGITGDYAPDGGNGVIVTIVHNLTTIKYSRTITNGDGDLAYAFNLSCTLGDTLDFVIDPNTDANYDSTHFTAHIAGTSPPSPPPPPPSPTPPPPPPAAVELVSMTTTADQFDISTSAVITLTITPASSDPTTVMIESADPAVVSAPTTVTIPANSLAAGFTVLGVGIGTTQLTATLGTVSKHLTLTVLPTASLSGVTLFAPANRATLPATTKFVILRWSAIVGAHHYELRVVDDTIPGDNNHPTCAGTRVCETAYLPSSYSFPVKPGHTYTWSVVWIDATGVTSATSSRTFSVNLNP